MADGPNRDVKYYTLDDVIKIKEKHDKKGEALPFGFDTHPMLFTDPDTNKVVEVFAQDVVLDIGHKVGDTKYPGTTTKFGSDNQLIITTAGGDKLNWKEATPYYRVELSVLQNNKFSPEVEVVKGYWFKKECIGAIGCHFDWSLVSCTSISRLDGGK